MAGAGSPYLNRVLHDSVGIGKITFPSDPREGVAIVEINTSQRIDKQKASGTDKSKMKRAGKEPADVKITLRWTYRIDDEVQEMLAYLDPDGPNDGGPFALVHPKAQRRRVKDIIVEKMSDVKNLTPALYEVTLTASQWIPVPKVQGKATATPKTSDEWVTGTFASNTVSGAAVGATGVTYAQKGVASAFGAAFEKARASLDGPNAPDDKP